MPTNSFNISPKDLERMIENILQTLEAQGIKLTDAEKNQIKEKVAEAVNEAFPAGVSKTFAQSQTFTQDLVLCVTGAVAKMRNPELDLNLSLIMREPSADPFERNDLRAAIILLLTEINKMQPPAQQLRAEEIEQLADECIKDTDPKRVLEIILREKFVIDFLEEERLNAEANVSGGVTHNLGEVRPSMAVSLIGNLQGWIQQDGAFRGMGTLQDSVVRDPSANTGVQAALQTREKALGILVTAFNEAEQTAAHVCSPRPSGPV